MFIHRIVLMSALSLLASCATVKQEEPIVPPILASTITPVYPSQSIAERQVGIAVILVNIRADGTVRHVSIVESSGFDKLDENAIETAYKWHFKPSAPGRIEDDASAKIPVAFLLNAQGSRVTICSALPSSSSGVAPQVTYKGVLMKGDVPDDPLRQIYATVVTAGCGKAQISVDWLYGETLINETTQRILQDGPTLTAFKLSNANSWPLGNYRVIVKIDGALIATKVFSIAGNGMNVAE